MKIKPLLNRVVVLPVQSKSVTNGGIIIPDSAREKPQKGEVMAVGDGTSTEPMVVKVGDIVLYGKYAGTEISHEGNNFLLLVQSDIYAII